MCGVFVAYSSILLRTQQGEVDDDQVLGCRVYGMPSPAVLTRCQPLNVVKIKRPYLFDSFGVHHATQRFPYSADVHAPSSLPSRAPTRSGQLLPPRWAPGRW